MTGVVRSIRKHDPIVRSSHNLLSKAGKALGFGGDEPSQQQPPPPPAIEDTEARQQDEADRLRKRRGRAAAILTDGNAGAPLTASKTLLGA